MPNIAGYVKNHISLTTLLITLLVVIGVLLRINASIKQSFWMDETTILSVSRNNSVMRLILMHHWDRSHPQLYYLFIHFWQQINSNSLFLRFPSVVVYIPTAITIFLIGRSLHNSITGMLSLLLFSVNPFFVNLGFQQKMYSFVMMFMMLSLYVGIKIISDYDKYRNDNLIKYAFIVISTLGFFTDYSFIWFWAAFCLTVLIMMCEIAYRSQVYILFKLIIIASLIMSVQIPVFISGLRKAIKLEQYLGTPDVFTLQNAVESFIGLFHHTEFCVLLTFGVSIVGVINIIYSGKDINKKFINIFVILGFFFTLVTSFIISQYILIFLPRNMLVASWIFVFILPVMVTNIPKRFIQHFLIIVLLLLCGYMARSSVQLLEGFEGNEPWKKIYLTAKEIQGFVTLVYIGNYNYKIAPLEQYYFSGHYDHTTVNYDLISIPEFDLTDTKSVIDRIGIRGATFFVADQELMKKNQTAISRLYNHLCTSITCYGLFEIY